jgi:hypothetical protein
MVMAVSSVLRMIARLNGEIARGYLTSRTSSGGASAAPAPSSSARMRATYARVSA